MNEILKNRIIENHIILPIDIKTADNNKPIKVTDDYIDIGYSSSQTPARILSNLYPYKFDYYGNEVSSIEAAIQSLKYEDVIIRKVCYTYSGIDAVHLRGMAPYDWQKDGMLYTPIRPIDRFSEVYQIFLDELYFFAFQNPLYKNNLLNSSPKALDHTIGENDKHFSTLTRSEYISRLYALRYCLENNLSSRNDVTKILIKVRQELTK
jgi:Bacteriophage protein GP30.